MPKIIFHSAKHYNNSNVFHPVPSKTLVPEWFSSASRFWKDENGNMIFNEENKENLLGFKACPALMDSFIMGYTMVTPCDIHFFKIGGKISVSYDDLYRGFCDRRDPISEFVVPTGYDDYHFHWFPNWMPELPEGYSALYLNPINRFDLPFYTVSGIVDNDKMSTPGLMPFFLKKDFIGTIKAGTPYVQIIPFKRESWQIEKIFHSEIEMVHRHNDSAKKFRIPGGGGYKKQCWSRKDFS